MKLLVRLRLWWLVWLHILGFRPFYAEIDGEIWVKDSPWEPWEKLLEHVERKHGIRIGR